ncbi:related to protein DGCR14, probably involved in pre-mRNA splicing [Ustilago trichophora]|uniref:Related to protein DGCR14, probably involved in pre-mRNA splicing n=1 Tax=Ustilago trichophora TaxID=86804 RepID=A0A5C3DSC8_9BASI|nr:related to protein DGCR14, probably involved in pre-mRNA splicing [Ustilago trichophora]
MPLRKEPPTPRSDAVNARLHPTHNGVTSTTSGMGPLIPFKPGQSSLRKQAILTEDEYTSALSSIIKRDFFPNLDRIAAENEYLTAIESDDPRWIRIALDKLLRFDGSPAMQTRKQRRKDVPGQVSNSASGKGEWDDTPIATGSGSRVFNPTFTPAASTPGINVDGEEAEEEQVEPGSGITPDIDLSLAAFQSRYTSEDNASFSQLLDRDNQQRKRKHAHLFAREQASEQRRKRITHAEQADAERGKQLAIEANPDHPKLLEQARSTLLIGDGTHQVEDTGNDKGKQKEKEQKDPLDDLILVPESRKDDRPTPTGLNRWKYTARNAFMYGPDANEAYLHARPTSASTNTTAGEDSPTKPSTNFSALRLPEHTDSAGTEREDSVAGGWSPTSSRIDAAIQRGRTGSVTSSSSETPKVNGYGFVTPYSTPQHHHPPAAAQQEMHLKIYNAIKAKRAFSTRTLLTNSADVGGRGHFELPQWDKREKAAQRLVSTASPKPASRGMSPYGVKKYTGLAALESKRFGSPRSWGKGKRELTPAARALLERSSRGSGMMQGVASVAIQRGGDSKGGSGGGGVGGRGWTPTPQHVRRLPLD